MKFNVGKILVVTCSFYAFILNSCYQDANKCLNSERNCKDSVLASFNMSNEAKQWWINDSISTGSAIFKNNIGITLTFTKSKSKSVNNKTIGYFKSNPDDRCDEFVDCDISIEFEAYQFTYNEPNRNFRITLNLDRIIPENRNNIENSNWVEHLVFANNNRRLRVIPGVNNPMYSNHESIQSLTINSKTYSDVIHVYDSSLVNNSSLDIVGYYYTPTEGIIRYYLNNNEVWSIQ